MKPTARSQLFYRLKQLKPHDHLCSLYRSRQEQFETAIPFIGIGLERGEKCIYVTDVNTPDQILAAVRKRGIDVESAVRSGALVVATKQETYLRSGAFDPDRMLRFWEQATDSATAAGFSALRATGEVTRISSGPGTERWVEYESRVNDLFRDNPCLGLCQYDQRCLSPDVALGILQAHPLVLYAGRIQQNECYIPPDEFLRLRMAREQIERLLGQTLSTLPLRKPLQLDESARELLRSYLRVGRFRRVHGL